MPSSSRVDGAVGPSAPELRPPLVARITCTCSGASRASTATYVERLQKQLARELQTDPAATPITQNTRLPGFFNHKHAAAAPRDDRVPRTSTGGSGRRTSQPSRQPLLAATVRSHESSRSLRSRPAVERARRYLASVPPAIAGQHGDVHTFRVCCRLVRGFALDDDQALARPVGVERAVRAAVDHCRVARQAPARRSVRPRAGRRTALAGPLTSSNLAVAGRMSGFPEFLRS